MTNSEDFNRGVNWGKFVATIHDSDDARSDDARLAALVRVVDHLEQHPDPATMNALMDGWFDYKCHGYLSEGEICQKCGAINPGDDG